MTMPYRRVLAIFSLNLLIFLLARVGLFLVYFQDFHDLTTAEVLGAFVRGLAFDASIIMLVTGLPLLMLLVPFIYIHQPQRLRLSSWIGTNVAVIVLAAVLVWLSNMLLHGRPGIEFRYAVYVICTLALLALLPFRASHGRLWVSFWTWTSFATMALFLLLLAADLIYFGFVHRHIGPEITAIGGDVDLMLDMAFGTYGWALLLYAGACVGLLILWRRLFRNSDSELGPFMPRVATLLGALVGVALLVRGGMGNKPLDVVDAFVGSQPAAAYLSLNGPFAMSHALVNARKINANYFPWQEAVKQTRAQVLADGERFTAGDEYPLFRVAAGGGGKRPNVVVMMLESWDAIHNDAMRRAMGLKPYEVTPNFDALTRQGVLFTRFYANGERSMDGLASLIAGIPTLPGTAYIGMGMEQNRMAYLGHMAQQEGYDTIFLQSSKRQSFHVDSIAAMAGFRTYLGAEDIPATGHSELVTERGAWDHDMFQEANRRFAAARKPFVGFLFTASTHLPLQLPGKRWEKFSPDSLEHRYLNALYYADWALGEFFAAARKAGYFENTIFILTADHVSGLAGTPGDIPSLHHVPLLVIAPGLKSGTRTYTGGQVDVIPTIVHLAGWKAPQAGLGHNLLASRQRTHNGTLTVRGNVIERIEDGGWVAHDLQHRIAASPGMEEAELKGMEDRMLAMYQVAHGLLLHNRIVPPDHWQDVMASSR